MPAARKRQIALDRPPRGHTTAPMPPMTISFIGRLRHLDKSNSAGCVESLFELIGYFLNGPRSGSGTSSSVAN